MFKPNYRITEYFLDCIEKIATLQTEIRKSHIRLPLLLKLQKEAFNRNVHSSTWIEGNQLSLQQVAVLNEQKDVRADESQKKEVKNYINALRWVIDHANQPIKESDLLRLHHLVTLDLVAEGKGGKYRKIQNYVVDGQQRVVYTPPLASEVPKLMRELLEWTTSKSEKNAVIVSAIFHHQFITIHPFADGNGRIARAVSLWILYQRKYDPVHIIALDEYFSSDREAYYLKIRQARELDYDLTHWLEYIAKGVLESLENTIRRVYQLAISPKKDVLLSAKQEVLIHFIKLNGGCGSKDIGAALKVNRARVNQLITPLVKAGIIRIEGKARTTKYFLS
jgi:cell filamentation protein, protein adenylyltransferase